MLCLQLNTVLTMEGSGFEQLLADSKIPVLKLIYNICSRVPQQGPAAIRGLLQKHIKSAGQVRPLLLRSCTLWNGFCVPVQSQHNAANSIYVFAVHHLLFPPLTFVCVLKRAGCVRTKCCTHTRSRCNNPRVSHLLVCVCHCACDRSITLRCIVN